MKSFKFVIAAITLLIGGHASAETKVMSALDVALDVAELKGQIITVQNCVIFGASLRAMLCGVYTESGSVGSITVEVKNMNRADLRRALKRCAGLGRRAACKASITGRIGVNYRGAAEIDGKKIHWQ